MRGWVETIIRLPYASASSLSTRTSAANRAGESTFSSRCALTTKYLPLSSAEPLQYLGALDPAR